MAGGKLSPRQKMINMMYLVLMALLALNVSAEILKAFYLVEQSMNKAGANIDSKNGDFIAAFEKQMKTQPDKVKPYYEKAKQAVKINDEFYKYVEDLKTQVVTEDGKVPITESRAEDGQLVNRDNIEVHAHLMIAEGGPQKGVELRNKIEATRESLLKVLKDLKLDADAKRISEQTDLIIQDEGSHKWESILFEHSPQAAVVTLLTKIQNDSKNTLSDVLSALFQGITAEERSFDMLVAKIIPKATSVSAGEKFEAEVILTAYDSKQANEVVINGKAYEPENGIVKYEEATGGIGNRTVKGVIKVAVKDQIKEYPFETEYNVYKGAASVSADAMNVLYIGLDNPITIAVPGYTPEQIRATISAGSLNSKGSGQYQARVSQRGDVSISVSVNDGKTTKHVGTTKFRVRSIPKPEAKLGTLESGIHSAGSIQAQPGVYGSLGEGFAYEGVKYSVLAYTFVYAPKRGDALVVMGNGTPLPAGAKGIMNRLKSGDRIIIDGITATGPDGKRNLSPLVITVR